MTKIAEASPSVAPDRKTVPPAVVPVVPAPVVAPEPQLFDARAFSPKITQGAPLPPAGTQFDPRFTQPATRFGPAPLPEDFIQAQASLLRAASDARKAEAIEWARVNQMPIRGSTEGGGAFELMAVDNGVPRYYTTDNANAAISTGVDPYLRSTYTGIDLRGLGWGVGVWDAGPPRSSHQELFDGSSYRAVFVDLGAGPHYGNIPDESHSTHVAGTLVARGVKSAAMGMAPEATAYCQNWDGVGSELLADGASAPGQRDKLYVSNHSYGPITGWEHFNKAPEIGGTQMAVAGWYWMGDAGTKEASGFGRYDAEAVQMDEVVWMRPYHLPFKSSGNDRGNSPGFFDSAYYPQAGGKYVIVTWGITSEDAPGQDGGADGYDTIGGWGNAKNVMTVGNLKDAVSNGSRSVDGIGLVASSSMGPTDDGRIKPDIVANGESLYSCDKGSDTDYSNKTGTSMASPNAAGSALLLHEYYTRSTGQYLRASTLKALIIQTATDIGAPGPDYSTGWGLMDASKALITLRTHEDEPAGHHIVEGVLSTKAPEYRLTFRSEPGYIVTATLCWTDVAGAEASGLNNRTSKLVNDLDLRVIDANGLTYYPPRLDPTHPAAPATYGDNTTDNVERISFISTSSGVNELIVSHKGTLKAGIDTSGNVVPGGTDQVFSLILEGNHDVDSGTLAEGLDQPATQGFTMSGAKAWGYQTDAGSIGGNRVVSLPSGHGNTQAFETDAAGPQTVSFLWGVSSEPSFDTFRFLLDGVVIGEISGEVATTNFTRNLLPGAHRLRWEYRKDGSRSVGQDRGWVDQLQFLEPPSASDSYAQNFEALPDGSVDLNDFSILTTDSPAVLAVKSISARKRLRLTAAGSLYTRSQYQLPFLAPATYGFVARFDYLLTPPPTGPLADGFGFYLKPASAVVDAVNNQVGGYSQGIGVEFITYGSPRQLLRVNGVEQPGSLLTSPTLNGVTSVVIDYRTAPGEAGTITVTAGGQVILNALPVPAGYQPQPTDVFVFAARTGGFAETLSIDNVSVRVRTRDGRSYQQDFNAFANGVRDLKDGSTLVADPAIARVNHVPGGNPSLILTGAEKLFTRTQWTLPELRPSIYGFTARFSYAIVKPPTGPWADGLGFYLRPPSEPVDVANNQVGGYARGLGVDLITYSNPRHQIRVNDVVLPDQYPVSPHVDGSFSEVVIDFDTAPGRTGSLSLSVDGRMVLRGVPVDYTPSLEDVFTVVARTGGFAETLLIDDVLVTPKSKRPATNLTARLTQQIGDVVLVEVKWDAEPGGVYDVYVSQDLENWFYSRPYTATGNSKAFVEVAEVAKFPHLYFKVLRQQ